MDTHQCSPKCFLQEKDKTDPQKASCSLRWIFHSCFQVDKSPERSQWQEDVFEDAVTANRSE